MQNTMVLRGTTRISCGFLIIFTLSMKTEACFDMNILKIKNTVHTIFIW